MFQELQFQVQVQGLQKLDINIGLRQRQRRILLLVMWNMDILELRGYAQSVRGVEIGIWMEHMKNGRGIEDANA